MPGILEVFDEVNGHLSLRFENGRIGPSNADSLDEKGRVQAQLGNIPLHLAAFVAFLALEVLGRKELFHGRFGVVAAAAGSSGGTGGSLGGFVSFRWVVLIRFVVVFVVGLGRCLFRQH